MGLGSITADLFSKIPGEAYIMLAAGGRATDVATTKVGLNQGYEEVFPLTQFLFENLGTNNGMLLMEGAYVSLFAILYYGKKKDMRKLSTVGRITLGTIATYSYLAAAYNVAYMSDSLSFIENLF
ncbi:MAG: hypothetical protein ABIJ18_02310 [archaeon]